MSKSVWLLLLGITAAGCRCDGAPSEDVLPSRPNPAQSAEVLTSDNCPARPAWAGSFDDNVEVELLHHSNAGGKEHGTGYRLRRDGTFETYDDIKVEKNDAGKLVFNRVDGAWAQKGTVMPNALSALRTAIADQPANELKGKWRTKGPRTARTHLTTVRDGSRSEVCYLGDEAPASIQALQKKIHDLVNHVEPPR